MTMRMCWPLLGGFFWAAILPGANAGLTNLYNFMDDVDGASPQAGLIQGANGLLYGTTLNGGSNGFGTAYSVTTAGTLAPLYSFTGDVDGAAPWGGLLQVSNGNFYGTTLGGGNGYGTIFRITTGGALTPLYGFTGAADGATPEGSLALGPDGNLYGTTAEGGTHGAGGIFRITTNGSFTALYSFTGGADGVSPQTGLTLGTNGSFYGVASSGGAAGAGTVFKITTAGQFSLLYTFANAADGALPQVPLARGSDGNFYGVASAGGVNHNGTIFRLTAAGGFTALYSFSADNGSGTNADGIGPSALLQGTDGNLYGATQNGGANGGGTLFRATLTGALTTLYTFGAASSDTTINVDGANPSGIVQGRDGNFYGTTLSGGPDALGTIFAWAGAGAPAFLTPGGVQYTNGQAILRITGLTGQGSVVIDASTNLTQWVPILTNPPATGQIQLTDTAAHNFPRRFYRARLR